MVSPRTQINLELIPQARVDVINVSERITEQFGDILSRFQKVFYYSYHTTAGYFDQSFCRRLNHSRDSLQAFVQSFQNLFPPDANYQHDQLQLRSELSEEQRLQEPRNADSHLTFIGSGLRNGVTYRHCPETPVYFVDLDGISGTTKRRRQTTVIGYNAEELVKKTEVGIPLSSHPVDSVNLKDSRLGLFDQLHELLEHYEIVNGRIDISLAPTERHAGLTVNEYETLLMKHDLAEVLRNPLRFMAEKGKHMLRDPRAIPVKAKNYAKYDMVQVVNEFLDALGLSESLLERIINKFQSVPAARFLGLKRSLSLLVSQQGHEGRGSIVQGEYQSPILVQWKKAAAQTRRLKVAFVRFR